MITKEEVLRSCYEEVEKKIAQAKAMMDAAQASANEETKSSAGDKYETGRAMAQQERDKAAAQMEMSLKLKRAFDQIKPEQQLESAAFGSMVCTNQAIFFISTGLGQIELDGTQVFVVSPLAPLSQKLLGKKAGDSITFNGREYGIQSVY